MPGARGALAAGGCFRRGVSKPNPVRVGQPPCDSAIRPRFKQPPCDPAIRSPILPWQHGPTGSSLMLRLSAAHCAPFMQACATTCTFAAALSALSQLLQVSPYLFLICHYRHSLEAFPANTLHALHGLIDVGRAAGPRCWTQLAFKRVVGLMERKVITHRVDAMCCSLQLLPWWPTCRGLMQAGVGMWWGMQPQGGEVTSEV
jgi:hypothetical protein